MIVIFIKRGNLDINKHIGRTPYEDKYDKAEAKEYERLSATSESHERGREQASEGTNPPDLLILIYNLRCLNHFVVFVTATLAN